MSRWYLRVWFRLFKRFLPTCKCFTKGGSEPGVISEIAFPAMAKCWSVGLYWNTKNESIKMQRCMLNSISRLSFLLAIQFYSFFLWFKTFIFNKSSFLIKVSSFKCVFLRILLLASPSFITIILENLRIAKYKSKIFLEICVKLIARDWTLGASITMCIAL